MYYTHQTLEIKYEEIKKIWEEKLKDYGVQLPKLKANNYFTKDALILIYFYDRIEQPITKEELTEFLRNMGTPSQDVQQARHLSKQKGWYIISGQRGDLECKEYNLKPGEYLLVSLEKPYPPYEDERRLLHLSTNSWDELKAHHNNRCVSCGSKEGEKNFLYPNTITKLQQGHKNPNKALSLDNIIPQCQFCNGSYQDFFVFDNNGKIKKINNPQFILKSDEEVQTQMLEILLRKDIEKAEKLIKEIKEQAK